MDNLNWLAKSQHGRATALENRTRILAVSTQPGTGAECAYCSKTITATSVEHWVQAIVRGGVRTLRFHRGCHHLWESHELEHCDGEMASYMESGEGGHLEEPSHQ